VPERTLTTRVENLERRVELLEALPARVSAVEWQIRQLRTEMGEQFSVIRQEFAAADSGVREEIRALRTDLRAELRAEGEAIRTELRAEIKAEGDVVRTELRKEIRDGDEETRRYMRVLHEEVLSRIAIIQEGLPRQRKRESAVSWP
jgi:phage host-nuclease inhibitor protein Gam